MQEMGHVDYGHVTVHREHRYETCRDVADDANVANVAATDDANVTAVDGGRRRATAGTITLADALVHAYASGALVVAAVQNRGIKLEIWDASLAAMSAAEQGMLRVSVKEQVVKHSDGFLNSRDVVNISLSAIKQDEGVQSTKGRASRSQVHSKARRNQGGGGIAATAELRSGIDDKPATLAV